MPPDPSAKETDPVPEDKPRVTPKGAAKALARRQRLASAGITGMIAWGRTTWRQVWR